MTKDKHLQLSVVLSFNHHLKGQVTHCTLHSTCGVEIETVLTPVVMWLPVTSWKVSNYFLKTFYIQEFYLFRFIQDSRIWIYILWLCEVQRCCTNEATGFDKINVQQKKDINTKSDMKKQKQTKKTLKLCYIPLTSWKWSHETILALYRSWSQSGAGTLWTRWKHLVVLVTTDSTPWSGKTAHLVFCL